MKRVLETMLDISWNKKMKRSEICPKHFTWLKRKGYINVLGVWVRLSKSGSRAMLGL